MDIHMDVHIYYNQVVGIQCFLTSAKMYDKLNCSNPFTIEFHIIQSMHLAIQVTYNARKQKHNNKLTVLQSHLHTYFKQ